MSELHILSTEDGSYCEYSLLSGEWRTWSVGTYPSKNILKLSPKKRVVVPIYDIARSEHEGDFILKCTDIKIIQTCEVDDYTDKFICMKIIAMNVSLPIADEQMGSRIQPQAIDVLGYINKDLSVTIIWGSIEVNDCYSFSITDIVCWIASDIDSPRIKLGETIVSFQFEHLPLNGRVCNVRIGNQSDDTQPVYRSKIPLQNGKEIFINYNYHPLRVSPRGKNKCCLL